MKCASCGSARIRRSRLRTPDWQEILGWTRLGIRLRYPVRCRSCGKRSFVSIWAALKLPSSLHRRHWLVRYLRRIYYVACVAVSLATFSASWRCCWELARTAGAILGFSPEAWELAGAILGCILSAVLSMIVLFWLLGRGYRPKSGRSRTTTLSGTGSPDKPPADAPHREVPKSSAEKSIRNLPEVDRESG
jgi:hypothetical protein